MKINEAAWKNEKRERRPIQCGGLDSIMSVLCCSAPCGEQVGLGVPHGWLTIGATNMKTEWSMLGAS